MQAFKKKDPYIKSTRYEVVKPTFNGKSQIEINSINIFKIRLNWCFIFQKINDAFVWMKFIFHLVF